MSDWERIWLHNNPSGHLTQAIPNTPPVYSRDFAYPFSKPVGVGEPGHMARSAITETSAVNFAELLSGDIVDVYVGQHRRRWSVHRNLLDYCAPHFNETLNEEEAPENDLDRQKLELLDQDPRGFELLVKWLYQGQLEDISKMATEEQQYQYAVACHKLHLICDTLKMPRLQSMAMDHYRRALFKAQLVPDAEEINEIYQASPINGPFRRLMTKIAARQIMDPGAEKDAASYRKCFEDDPDFAVDLVNEIRRMSGGILFADPTKGDERSWHVQSTAATSRLARPGKLHVRNESVPSTNLAIRRPSPSHLPELSADQRTPRKIDDKNNSETSNTPESAPDKSCTSNTTTSQTSNVKQAVHLSKDDTKQPSMPPIKVERPESSASEPGKSEGASRMLSTENRRTTRTQASESSRSMSNRSVSEPVSHRTELVMPYTNKSAQLPSKSRRRQDRPMSFPNKEGIAVDSRRRGNDTNNDVKYSLKGTANGMSTTDSHPLPGTRRASKPARTLKQTPKMKRKAAD